MEVAQARTASREVQVSAEAFSTPPPPPRHQGSKFRADSQVTTDLERVLVIKHSIRIATLLTFFFVAFSRRSCGEMAAWYMVSS